MTGKGKTKKKIQQHKQQDVTQQPIEANISSVVVTRRNEVNIHDSYFNSNKQTTQTKQNKQTNNTNKQNKTNNTNKQHKQTKQNKQKTKTKTKKPKTKQIQRPSTSFKVFFFVFFFFVFFH